jgi:hypothetical protein
LKAAATGRVLTRWVGRLPGLNRWGDGRTTLVPAARSFTDRWKAGEV